MLKICFIIVNYNTWSHLLRLIKNILSTCPIRPFRIVVVDNASPQSPPDDFSDFLNQNKDIMFICNDNNMGYAGAINKAFKRCDAEYLMILNPDIQIPPGGIEKLYRFLDEHPTAGAVAPGIKRPDDKVSAYSPRRFPTLKTALSELLLLNHIWKNNPIAKYYFYDYTPFDNPVEVETVLGAAVLIKSRTYSNISGMDTRFFLYFEETDFFKRMADSGLHLFYLPEPCWVHCHGQSTKTTIHREVTYYESMLYYFKKHHRQWEEECVRWLIIAGALIEMVYFSLKHLFLRTKYARQKNAAHISIRIKRIIKIM